jgi:hypothetical protein
VLKSIDILIGLTVVLLALSMAVTLLTQVIISALNSRGRHLLHGLVDLLQNLDPALTQGLSEKIATEMLTHPLVSGARTGRNGKRRLGNVVHREEFTKLLLGLAAGDGTQKLEASAREALTTALANNGITNPADTLKNIRTVALQLERSQPALSNTVRQNAAILQEAGSDLVAKINGWFDQTMDRTSQRFTASTRAITFVAAAFVAVGLQVNTPALVNRLAVDDELRSRFVSAAVAGEVNPDALANNYQSFLDATGIIRIPRGDLPGYLASFRDVNPFGVLITALLLSFGAPFWYNVLGKLLQLRSLLAQKDDAQRLARQASETTSTGTVPSTGATAPVTMGERGDLAAVG